MKPDSDGLPPYDREAETSVLACVVLSDGEAERLFEQLTLEDFYDESNKAIFRALSNMRQAGRGLDHVGLVQWCKDHNFAEGLRSFALGLPDTIHSAANFPSWLETVRDRTARRAVLHDTAEMSLLARDTSKPSRTITEAARRLFEVYATNGSHGEGLTIRKPDELLAMRFDDSDCILGDRLLANGQSLVIAGAGSIGKSRFLLQLAVATITGRQFIGFETHTPGLRWLILQAENSNRRLQADLAALRSWVGDAAWPMVNDCLCIHTLETTVDGFLSLDDPSARSRTARAIGHHMPDAVGFDSLYNFGIGDLNSDQDMAATLLGISRLCRADNPERLIAVLHHALTGKAGAARAAGFDRTSFGRNSKVLHSWTRAQINLAPGSPDTNEFLVVTCGKNSNGKEFAPFAVRLNPETMIYEPAPDFDLAAWESDVAGKPEGPLMTPERVAELCKLPMSKADLAKAITNDCGCYRGSAYRYIERATKAKNIHFNKDRELYTAK